MERWISRADRLSDFSSNADDIFTINIKTFRSYLETSVKTFNWINFNQNLPSRELFVCLFTIWCQLEQARQVWWQCCAVQMVRELKSKFAILIKLSFMCANWTRAELDPGKKGLNNLWIHIFTFFFQINIFIKNNFNWLI